MADTEFAFARIAAARVGDELMVRRINARMVVFAFWWCPDILATIRLPAEVRFENRVYFRAGHCLKSSRFLEASIDRVGPKDRETDILSFGDCEIDANAFVDHQKFTVLGLPVLRKGADAPAAETVL
jgi:hypothetical protein